ncbi:3-dehydroquinate synthase [Acutalibacter caecimuris]|uniref:3-dehydroquinate synthase n=1 Tax=Acutalibacter caecimuris TaxID=3093657 RepID=UPI002AC91D60|nr:3-dehydroquinate synthase [Acutalibacter sp. M00118]
MEIQVNTTAPYTVTVERGAMGRVGEILGQRKKPGARVMVISDSHVAPLYGPLVRASLEGAGFRVSGYTFPAGEEHKLMDTVCGMYQALAEEGFTRTDLVVTLGGGVAGDMGGFAAATFLRGMDFAQVPTSLVAQADASVGGKTGVDLPFGKNLVGAFHQPVAVITDPDALGTLPRHYFNDGLGEVIKHGCIADPALFAALEQGAALADMEQVVGRSIAIKRDFVEADTRDTGRRMILNFGHTCGHALEKLHRFKGLSHGEAVGIGMVLACRAGEKLGITKPGTGARVAAVLRQYGLPDTTGFTPEEIVAATALDKKSDGDSLRFIFIKDVGESVIYPMGRQELLQALL